MAVSLSILAYPLCLLRFVLWVGIKGLPLAAIQFPDKQTKAGVGGGK
jgi:hypothetical protein